ncbi:TetR/AcrR family transcriptional regulator [Streptomyces avicenniae]|uniref:TetR/AcrR family transcriptional regulator n=1 Tax=Streptomyces avicenniae TaxID=500153 RepID=UPI000699EF96|nr:TetR family transcriptional regulator [Streptomyces avicenniae]
MSRQPAAPLSGRRAQAARNDIAILAAARDVLLADPDAPVAAVAAAAGVGISALYRRHGNKEGLLRHLCHDGLRRYVTEAETALADPDGWRGLTGFLARVVEADVHSLTVRFAGTFAPTPEMRQDAERAAALAAELVARAHASGRLRPDAGTSDLALLLESCAAVRVPDPARTAQLRSRCLALLTAGLASREPATLPGPPPAPDEFIRRWRAPDA